MCPGQTAICPICSQPATAGLPVVFDYGAIAHPRCYVDTEEAATLVRSFLDSRPRERFCYSCLAQQLVSPRRETEKAAIALRVTLRVVAEPGTCSGCDQARVTIRIRAPRASPA